MWRTGVLLARLRIHGRRADGYHLLDSLMVPISLYDELQVSVSPRPKSAQNHAITVTSDSAAAPGGPANLAHRAAALFLAGVGSAPAVDIRLSKRIPVGSGLGGGSSDAAAVLLALNRLLGCPLPTADLARVAARVGADVTFFVYGRPARVGGVGEQITPLEAWEPLSLVVCSDGYPLSTKLVYSRVDLSLTTEPPPSNIRDLISGRRPIPELLVNDLEAAAVQIHPEVLSLKARLMEQGALGALMTGSGAAVFGVWPDAQTAENAAMRLRERGLWAESVRTLEVSPAVGS
jgi:4-diphosphocytidyl-2-C-methyl-D-erythritol kinase